jgi:oligoribonuclease
LLAVLVWMDLEMTGLDPTKDVIVEIATLVTDDDLTIVAEGPDLVLHATDAQLAGMVPVVTEMHAASGLTEAIRASTLTLEDAREQTLAFLALHVPKGEVPLSGNSIHTDRRFLQEYLPDVEAWLHYRNVDVSTLKELLKRWRPDVVASAPEKASTHRAMEDVKASVDELRHYRAALFGTPATTGAA